MKWILEEPYTKEAIARLTIRERDQVRRLVPFLFLSEVNAVLLKQRRNDRLTAAECARAWSDILDTVEFEMEYPETAQRAFEIADGYELRKAYDHLYVALAERQGCELWTGDERLYNQVHHQFSFVRWVGEPL